MCYVMNKCSNSNTLQSICIMARHVCSSSFPQFGAPILRKYKACRKEKKRRDCTFWRQFNEKPSIIPGCPEQVPSDRCSRTQEYCDVRDNISTSSPLLPSWISCLPQTGTALLYRSETALWWPPHRCHLCEPCSEAPACTTYSQSGYYQRNEQAVPCFNFVLEMAVQCQRTVKAKCFRLRFMEESCRS